MHCHHEKTTVIDDRVAFMGGIDLTSESGSAWGGAPACPHYFWSMRFRGWMGGLWLSEPICVDARPAACLTLCDV